MFSVGCRSYRAQAYSTTISATIVSISRTAGCLNTSSGISSPLKYLRHGSVNFIESRWSETYSTSTRQGYTPIDSRRRAMYVSMSGVEAENRTSTWATKPEKKPSIDLMNRRCTPSLRVSNLSSRREGRYIILPAGDLRTIRTQTVWNMYLNGCSVAEYMSWFGNVMRFIRAVTSSLASSGFSFSFPSSKTKDAC